MSGVNRPPSLHFDHDLRLDDQIGAIASDRMAVKHNVERHLTLHAEPGDAEQDRERVCVDHLKEAVSELRMNGVERAEDDRGNLAMQQDGLGLF